MEACSTVCIDSLDHLEARLGAVCLQEAVGPTMTLAHARTYVYEFKSFSSASRNECLSAPWNPLRHLQCSWLSQRRRADAAKYSGLDRRGRPLVSQNRPDVAGSGQAGGGGAPGEGPG